MSMEMELYITALKTHWYLSHSVLAQLPEELLLKHRALLTSDRSQVFPIIEIHRHNIVWQVTKA